MEEEKYYVVHEVEMQDLLEETESLNGSFEETLSLFYSCLKHDSGCRSNLLDMFMTLEGGIPFQILVDYLGVEGAARGNGALDEVLYFFFSVMDPREENPQTYHYILRCLRLLQYGDIEGHSDEREFLRMLEQTCPAIKSRMADIERRARQPVPDAWPFTSLLLSLVLACPKQNAVRLGYKKCVHWVPIRTFEIKVQKTPREVLLILDKELQKPKITAEAQNRLPR